MTTLNISVYNLETFASKLAKLNRKAGKFGLAAITYEVGEPIVNVSENRFGERVSELVGHTVAVTGETLKLGDDYELVAVLDHKENLVRAVPGETLPTEYYGAAQECDHCHTRRERNETFVIRNTETKELRQVGRTCLGDFLGVSPAMALWQTGLVREFSHPDEEMVGRRETQGYGLDFYLSHVVKVIRRHGWVSRGAAYENGGVATADIAWEEMTEPVERKYQAPDTADKAAAELTAGWMATQEGENDYLYNLRTVGENGFVTPKSAGIAASGYAAMQRANERKAEAERLAESKHVGEVGQKLVATLTLKSSPSIDTQYGVCFFHRFEDDEGDVIIWKTGKYLEPGTYEVKATVKDHTEYKGVAQTVITRARVA